MIDGVHKYLDSRSVAIADKTQQKIVREEERHIKKIEKINKNSTKRRNRIGNLLAKVDLLDKNIATLRQELFNTPESDQSKRNSLRKQIAANKKTAAKHKAEVNKIAKECEIDSVKIAADTYRSADSLRAIVSVFFESLGKYTHNKIEEYKASVEEAAKERAFEEAGYVATPEENPFEVHYENFREQQFSFAKLAGFFTNAKNLLTKKKPSAEDEKISQESIQNLAKEMSDFSEKHGKKHKRVKKVKEKKELPQNVTLTPQDQVVINKIIAAQERLSELNDKNKLTDAEKQEVATLNKELTFFKEHNADFYEYVENLKHPKPKTDDIVFEGEEEAVRQSLFSKVKDGIVNAFNPESPKYVHDQETLLLMEEIKHKIIEKNELLALEDLSQEQIDRVKVLDFEIETYASKNKEQMKDIEEQLDVRRQKQNSKEVCARLETAKTIRENAEVVITSAEDAIAPFTTAAKVLAQKEDLEKEIAAKNEKNKAKEAVQAVANTPTQTKTDPSKDQGKGMGA